MLKTGYLWILVQLKVETIITHHGIKSTFNRELNYLRINSMFELLFCPADT